MKGGNVSTIQTREASAPRRADTEIPPAGTGDLTWPIRGRSVAILLGTWAALFGIFSLLGWWLVAGLSNGPIGSFDRNVSRSFEEMRTPALDDLTNWGSALSDTLTIVIALAVLTVGLLVVWRRWSEVVIVAGSVILETLTFLTVAFVVGRERPPVEQLDISPPTASFPSGHTAAAVAFYFGLAAVVAWHSDRRWVRVLAATAAATAVVIVALSRLYRGMHYVTDVTAGAIIGGLAVVAAIAALRAGLGQLHSNETPLEEVRS
jgi:undecaprenyl-diphosphatase